MRTFAVNFVKTPCSTSNRNVLPHRHGKQQPSWTTTDTKNDRNNNNNNSTTGKRGSISIVPRSDNGAYPHTLSTAIKDPITPHGPRFYEYGGFDIDPELQHNRKAYINERIDVVTKHFPNAIGMDDFLFRTEVMLRRFGFTADNSIALTSLCRDEITFPLKTAIHDIFGYSLDVDGLGGVITAGTTGLGAGFSHAPIDFATGRERYVLFALPHIAIDAEGKIGSVIRSGRAQQSCACGALVKMQPMFKQYKEGTLNRESEETCWHDPLDPEFSILTNRMMKAIDKEDIPDKGLGLVEVTKLANRVIQSDMADLIEKTVDVEKADYAVITGIQIHSTRVAKSKVWHPHLEFIAPTSMYIVNNGIKHTMDIMGIDPPTPRQLFKIGAGEVIYELPKPKGGGWF
ncbi:unnamed protein product [Bathycoccus prasinos]|mmetsp:Transcript_682/g.2441  ORF Transcript_682/g.2441 Transcript_682/m.2441 type:complete len:401 (+) Transcript_682:89-1291(+)